MGQRYGLEIRTAAVADGPGLAALFAEAGAEIPAHELAGRLDTLQRSGATALVALEWGPPSGLVALQVCRGLDDPRPFGLITTLLVGPAARRRGVGRLLLKAAARAARQGACDRLLLHAGPGQADLRAFGAATGFTEAGGVLARPLLRRGSAQD